MFQQVSYCKNPIIYYVLEVIFCKNCIIYYVFEVPFCEKPGIYYVLASVILQERHYLLRFGSDIL